jgi:hypothetical protein
VALPIAARAHEIVLIEENESTGAWASRTRFALG